MFGVSTRDQDDPPAGAIPQTLIRGMAAGGNLPEAKTLGGAIVACESRGVCGTDMSLDSESEATTLSYDGGGPPPELEGVM